jgi:hypothetical protein
MKIRTQHHLNGGVLVISLVICSLVGVMLIAYLSMVSNQHKLSQRSQVWNNCIPMCEAGIEEALAHLNHIDTTNNFAVNGWTSNSLQFHKTRPLNGGTTRIAISNDSPPTIYVTASLKAPVQGTDVTRRVKVKTRINLKFPNGVLSKGGISLGGSGRVDSFNSALPGFESDANGQYDPALATDRTSFVTTANTAGIINVGNMAIYGSIAMGPGGTASLGPNGNVGSTDWNDNNAYNGLIEPGHVTDDVNVFVPDIILPTEFGLPFGVQLPGPGAVGGTNYPYVLGNHDYRIAAFSLSAGSMMVTGKARIHVVGTTTISLTGGIILANTNASVEWYCQGSASFGGRGVINLGGFARNFSLIGLRTCPNITYSGSSRFVGTCYAPNTPVALSGTADAIGAIVARTFTLSGAMGLHYDESLKDPKKNRFIAASWQEL